MTHLFIQLGRRDAPVNHTRTGMKRHDGRPGVCLLLRCRDNLETLKYAIQVNNVLTHTDSITDFQNTGTATMAPAPVNTIEN